MKPNQYVIVNSEFDAAMDVEVLASAFNMSKAEFMGHRVLIDSFGNLDTERLNLLFKDNENYTPLTDAEIEALEAVPAVLVDEDWFMIVDNLYNFTEQYNGEGLYWNYWYHVWKTFSISPFSNAVVFVPGAPLITGIDVSPATATVGAGQNVLLTATVSTDHFASKAVDWSLTAVIAFPNILVNGGGSAVSSGATSVPFDGATVEENALVGRKVTFGSATTKYTITANTDSALTITPALAANVADNATIKAADSVSGDDVPATISVLGDMHISNTAVAGTVITSTATTVAKDSNNERKSDYATITVG